MSIQDARWVFSEAQTLATVSTIASTNDVRLGAGTDFFGTAVADDPAKSGRLWLNVVVDTTFVSAGAATLLVAFQDSLSTTAASFATVWTSETWAEALLVAGARLVQMQLPGTLREYVRLNYTLGGSLCTAGAINAWVGLEGYSR